MIKMPPGNAASYRDLVLEREETPSWMGGPSETAAQIIVFGAAEPAPRPPPGKARETWARQAIVDGWQRVFPGSTPSLEELQAAQTVGRYESGYGGWKNHPRCGDNGVGSNNWGSIQVAKLPKDGQCPVPNSFLCSDYDAVHDKTFAVCFYTYPTPADGAAAVIRNLTKQRPKTWAAIKSGDVVAISTAMYDEHYYGGFGKTREERIAGHVKAMSNNAKAIAAALGEELVIRPRDTPAPGDGASDGGGGSEGGSSGLVLGFCALAAAVAGGVWIANRNRLACPVARRPAAAPETGCHVAPRKQDRARRRGRRRRGFGVPRGLLAPVG